MKSSSPRQELNLRHLVYKTSALPAELHGQNTDAGPAFRDLSGSVIGRFASIRFGPVVEKSNPTRPLSSPRPESNRQPSLYESAALPLCYEGELEQAAGLEPAISALATRRSTTEPRLQEDPSRVSTREQGNSSRVSSLPRRSRAIAGRALGAPVYRRGGVTRTRDPLRPRQVRYHFATPRSVVPPVGLEPTTSRVRTACSALELRRRSGGEGRSRTYFACGHATDAARERGECCCRLFA